MGDSEYNPDRRVYELHPPQEGYSTHPSWPTVFLAGPVKGARDWQKDAAGQLGAFVKPVFVIANPRTDQWESFAAQVNWETFHLARASRNGVILFWCAKQETHDCARPHGQTTRFELGEWLAMKHSAAIHGHATINVVVGIEPGFTGEKYIRERIRARFPSMGVHDNLVTACAETDWLLAPLMKSGLEGA